ncbi:MAG TPA: hypothetical protein QF753_03870 [Victivallales bacterium]|nr:hypothetical protein [Victivallales bacterium]
MKTKTENLKPVKLLSLIFIAVLLTGFAFSSQADITKSEIIQAQNEWGKDLVSIGKAYTDGNDYKKVATELVNNLYDYQSGEVLFKPTKASDIPFRKTEKGAVSYFVGHNKNFPEDKGFALEPWTKVKFINSGIYIHNNMAMAMGEYFFTPSTGKTVKVEYTFGYIKNKNGKVKIVLHHSSLPYSK